MWDPRPPRAVRGTTLFFFTRKYSWSLDNALSVATGYWLDYCGSNPNKGKTFHFSTSSRPAFGPNKPSIEWVMGDIFPMLRRPGGETDHSPPSTAEVKHNDAIHALSRVFTAYCLINSAQGQLYVLQEYSYLWRVDIDSGNIRASILSGWGSYLRQKLCTRNNCRSEKHWLLVQRVSVGIVQRFVCYALQSMALCL
jgi:hypothetical protein